MTGLHQKYRPKFWNELRIKKGEDVAFLLARFGVKNALVSLNGPFVKYLLKQEDNCCKNLTRLGQNLWATFHSALSLYNSHKNSARRQSRGHSSLGKPWPSKPSSSALLSVNQTCHWRARAESLVSSLILFLNLVFIPLSSQFLSSSWE